MSGRSSVPSIVEQFAEDIAIWCRIYAHQDWRKDSPAVLNLAHRLARVAEQPDPEARHSGNGEQS